MDRLERLINLVAALKAAERPITRDEIHERVPGYPDSEASYRRAFERDKETLRGMGIPLSLEPVQAESGPVDGYRIRPEEYELPDPGLEPDELAALHLATSVVHLEGGDATVALWKLGGAGPDGPQPDIAMGGGDHLAALFAAVGARQVVRFRYRGEERSVDPWRIAFRNGRWYLSGRDHGRDDERQFRLDRMSELLTVGPAAAFERPPRTTATPPSWETGEDDPVAAELLVDGDQVAWATQFFGDERILERRPDGSVVFGLQVTNRELFRSLVLTFLDHAEVLAPPELRSDLMDWLESLA